MSSQAWAIIPASAPTMHMPVNAMPFAVAAPASPVLLRPNPFSIEALSMGPIATLTPAFMRSVENAPNNCTLLRGLLSEGSSAQGAMSSPSGIMVSSDNDPSITANNIQILQSCLASQPYQVLYRESVNSTFSVINQNSYCVTPSDVDDIARLTREIEAVMKVISDCYTNEDRSALANLCERKYLSHISDTFYEIIVHLANMLWVKSVQVISERVSKSC